MNPLLQKSLQHLTGENQIEQVSEETLRRLVQQYPFMGPARLLLAYKTKGARDHHQSKQNNQLAALYFCNQHWLHYLLNDEVSQEISFQPSFSFPSNNLSVPEDLPVGAPTMTLSSKASTPPSNEPVETASFDTTVEVPTLEAYKAMMDGNRAPQPPTPETVSEETKPIVIEPNNNKEPILTSSEDLDHNPFLEKVESKQATKAEADNKIAAILQAQLEAFKQPVPENAQVVTPQAHHMVDYFESQGIKIDLTQIPQDKLTTKLRKFTDWLRQMKNHNPNPVDLGTDPALETAVSAIAQTSNEMKEVVTETMADVLLKQGQVDKAIQLYIKLSFLNPEKSAYFAAKIQELKGIEK